ncbi:4-hydroxythreonine-4-phosphate dehydrogenase [Frankliniella fusca]|uniref:4-hydroxythreonine-4-phosphate dehydrogenase n=1 Tax=Frankliniella fusca TaxID=407009 RepID=A0AAE1GX30_9NEOP|nr:4-hydroxythreonine-4-phosphate dehydrogenase [Frankliniella fusca]
MTAASVGLCRGKSGLGSIMRSRTISHALIRVIDGDLKQKFQLTQRFKATVLKAKTSTYHFSFLQINTYTETLRIHICMKGPILE